MRDSEKMSTCVDTGVTRAERMYRNEGLKSSSVELRR